MHCLLSQELECLIPVAACNGGDDPNHGGGFEVVRKSDAADINRVPTKVFADARDLFLALGSSPHRNMSGGPPANLVL